LDSGIGDAESFSGSAWGEKFCHEREYRRKYMICAIGENIRIDSALNLKTRKPDSNGYGWSSRSTSIFPARPDRLEEVSIIQKNWVTLRVRPTVKAGPVLFVAKKWYALRPLLGLS